MADCVEYCYQIQYHLLEFPTGQQKCMTDTAVLTAVFSLMGIGLQYNAWKACLLPLISCRMSLASFSLRYEALNLSPLPLAPEITPKQDTVQQPSSYQSLSTPRMRVVLRIDHVFIDARAVCLRGVLKESRELALIIWCLYVVWNETLKYWTSTHNYHVFVSLASWTRACVSIMVHVIWNNIVAALSRFLEASQRVN